MQRHLELHSSMLRAFLDFSKDKSDLQSGNSVDRNWDDLQTRSKVERLSYGAFKHISRRKCMKGTINISPFRKTTPLSMTCELFPEKKGEGVSDRGRVKRELFKKENRSNSRRRAPCKNSLQHFPLLLFRSNERRSPNSWSISNQGRLIDRLSIRLLH